MIGGLWRKGARSITGRGNQISGLKLGDANSNCSVSDLMLFVSTSQ